MNPAPRLLPLGVMSARLGIASRNLRLAALSGAVPFVRVGKDALLFEPAAVEEALLRAIRSTQGQGAPEPELEDRRGC